jgi:hypothetical protein
VGPKAAEAHGAEATETSAGTLEGAGCDGRLAADRARIALSRLTQAGRCVPSPVGLNDRGFASLDPNYRSYRVPGATVSTTS